MEIRVSTSVSKEFAAENYNIHSVFPVELKDGEYYGYYAGEEVRIPFHTNTYLMAVNVVIGGINNQVKVIVKNKYATIILLKQKDYFA